MISITMIEDIIYDLGPRFVSPSWISGSLTQSSNQSWDQVEEFGMAIFVKAFALNAHVQVDMNLC